MMGLEKKVGRPVSVPCGLLPHPRLPQAPAGFGLLAPRASRQAHPCTSVSNGGGCGGCDGGGSGSDGDSGGGEEGGKASRTWRARQLGLQVEQLARCLREVTRGGERLDVCKALLPARLCAQRREAGLQLRHAGRQLAVPKGERRGSSSASRAMWARPLP